MDWLSAPQILEQTNVTAEKIVPTSSEAFTFFHPTAIFKYKGRDYQLTSSAGKRITFFTTENHIAPDTVYTGFIGNVSYEPKQDEQLELVIYRGNGFEYIDQEHEEFGLVKTAMEIYRDTPVERSNHAGWDQAIENSKRNIAGVLESLADIQEAISQT